MVLLVKLIGVAIACFGLAIFAYPPFSEKVFAFFKDEKRIYLAGVIRVLAGLLLLLSAARSLVPMAAIALGIMFLVSGIVIFSIDRGKLMGFITYYSEMPGLMIRLMGLVAASFGILIFSIY